MVVNGCHVVGFKHDLLVPLSPVAGTPGLAFAHVPGHCVCVPPPHVSKHSVHVLILRVGADGDEETKGGEETKVGDATKAAEATIVEEGTNVGDVAIAAEDTIVEEGTNLAEGTIAAEEIVGQRRVSTFGSGSCRRWCSLHPLPWGWPWVN